MGTAQPLRRLRRHLPINGDGAAPPAPSAPPPHQWGRRSPSGAFGVTSPLNGDGAAPPAPSAPPPHQWGRRSPSGAFGVTSPLNGDGAAPPAPSAPPPHEWGGVHKETRRR